MTHDPNCPFCQMISGQIPTKTVYNDSKVMAVLDINPASRGHVLIFPKKHYPIMPVIPPDEFKHLVMKASELSHSMKSSLVSTNNKIFIANGGAAGQQTSHFLMHVIPSDGLSNFNLGKRTEPDSNMLNDLKKNLTQMMANHYKREARPIDLIETKHMVENPNMMITIPQGQSTKGHMTIKPKGPMTKDKLLDIYYGASYASTAVFEYLKAHGTNIIINDDSNGIRADILERFNGDGLNFQWSPRQFDDGEMEKTKDAISFGLVGVSMFAPEVPVVDLRNYEEVETDSEHFITKKLNRFK